MSTSSIRYTGWLFILAIMVAVLFAGDLLVGALTGVNSIRQDAKRFRSETAFLLTNTQNLLPNLDHTYPNVRRPELDQLVPSGDPRILRTDDLGLIVDGSEAQGDQLGILFLGGSTTETNEVDEPFRFPAVAARELRELGISAVGLNAGVRGHTSLDSINALLNRFRHSNADFVVLMHNINDRLRLATRDRDMARLGRAAPGTFRSVIGAAAGLGRSLWEYVLYRSNALFILRFGDGFQSAWLDNRGSSIVDERSINFVDLDFPKHRSEFEQNLGVFIAITRSLGKTPVLMTQPLGEDSAAQEAFNASVRYVADKSAADLIDLERLLPPNRAWVFLSDGIHYSNLGSKAIGEIIAGRLAAIIRPGGPAAKAGRSKPAESISVSSVLSRCKSPSGDAPTLNPSSAIQLVGQQGRYPSFSSDGRWLLFQQHDNGVDSIKLYDIELEKYLDFTPDGTKVSERHPAFLSGSGDRFSVVFGSGFEPNSPKPEKLLVREWPTLKSRELIPKQGVAGSIPSPHPLGVAFAGQLVGNLDGPPDLMLWQLESQKVTNLTSTSWEEWRPAVSVDGFIYFIANPMGDFDIYRRGLNSDGREVFYRSDADEWDPAISPDGELVTFASKQFGSWDIFIANSNIPGQASRITKLPTDEWDPTFHPSGTLLAFAATTDDGPRIFGICLYGLNQA